MPEMHQNTSGGRNPPGSSGELMRSPRTLSCKRDLLLSEGREGDILLKGTDKWKGGDRGRKGSGRKSQK